MDGKEVEVQRELDDESILYLQENYIVTDGIFKDENIIFDNVTDEWKDVTATTPLAFEIPDYEPIKIPPAESCRRLDRTPPAASNRPSRSGSGPRGPAAWETRLRQGFLLSRASRTIPACGNAPLVLGIETSCDDTACAVLDGEGRVLASVVSSQLAAHRPYGGVVPEIASREHLDNWPAVSAEALAGGHRLSDRRRRRHPRPRPRRLAARRPLAGQGDRLRSRAPVLCRPPSGRASLLALPLAW